MLITPRQHQAMILPYLCLLVAAWAVTAGDRWAIVAAVAAGSVVVQTHLSYPVLAAALALVMIVGQVVTTREGAAVGGRRPFVVAGVLACLLWIQTVVDQFTGYGNLGHVLFGSGDAGRAGLVRGARIVAATLVSPLHVPASGVPRVRRRRPLRVGVAVGRLLVGARIRDRVGCGRDQATRAASLGRLARGDRRCAGRRGRRGAAPAHDVRLHDHELSLAVGDGRVRAAAGLRRHRPLGRSGRARRPGTHGLRRSGRRGAGRPRGRQPPALGPERRCRPVPRRAAQRGGRAGTGRRCARRDRRSTGRSSSTTRRCTSGTATRTRSSSRCRSTASTSASTTRSRNDDSGRDG